MARDFDVRLRMPRKHHSISILHYRRTDRDGLALSIQRLVRIAVFDVDLLIELLDLNVVNELGNTFADLASHEERSPTVEEFTVLVLPAFFLPNLDGCLGNAQGSTRADFVHILLVTSKEVAVELLKYFLSFIAKILKMKGRVIFLHLFDCLGALRIA